MLVRRISPSSPEATISFILLYTGFVRWLSMAPNALPLASAAAFSSRTSRVNTPVGFSSSTCMPAAKASFACATCALCGDAISTASIFPLAYISCGVSNTRTCPPPGSARSAAMFFSFLVATAARRTSGTFSSMIFACSNPIAPKPTMPNRT